MTPSQRLIQNLVCRRAKLRVNAAADIGVARGRDCLAHNGESHPCRLLRRRFAEGPRRYSQSEANRKADQLRI